MDPKAKELVAIATAVAGKCPPCFAYHHKQAQELGIAVGQIREAIQLAKDVRTSGDKHMNEFAERRMKSGTGEDPHA